MKRLSIICASILFVWTNLFGQIVVRPEINNIVQGIIKDNRLNSQAVGLTGARTEQWNRYIFLKENATTQELIDLTNHNNGVVRCYSFKALALRKEAHILPILINHLTDTAIISTFQGCLISSQRVGDNFFETVSPEYAEIGAFTLSDNEKQYVDSILIFDKKVQLSAKSILLRKLKPNQIYYNRLREIVIEDNDYNALIALSKFQNQQDKDLIIERLNSNDDELQYYGLQAVIFFPDSSFFPILKNIHTNKLTKAYPNSVIRTLYQAIVQYKAEPSKELLEFTLKTAEGNALKYHSQMIWLALELYPNEFFEEVQQRIRIDDFDKQNLIFWIENRDL